MTRDRILIVDDEGLVLRVLRRLMPTHLPSYTPLLTDETDSPGQEAIDLYRRHKDQIAAVMLDGQFNEANDPAIDSFAVLRVLKEDGFPGIIVAASAKPEIREQQMANGCTHTGQNLKGETLEYLATLLPKTPTD